MTRLSILIFLLLLSCHVSAQRLIPYLADKKYGFADIHGQMKIKADFDEVEFFDQNNVANVRKGSHWSIINKQGKLLFPFDHYSKVKLDHVINHPGPDTLFHLRQQILTPKSFRLLNLKSWNATPTFDFNNEKGYQRAQVDGTYLRGLLTGRISDSHYQVVNSDAETMLHTPGRPEIWNDSIVSVQLEQVNIYNVNTGKFIVLPYRDMHGVINGQYFIVSKWSPVKDTVWNRNLTQLYGIVDGSGDTIAPFIFRSLWGGYAGRPLIARTDKKTFFIDLQGNRIDTNVYSTVYRTNGDLLKGQLENQKWVFLDDWGRRPIPHTYDSVFSINTTHYGYREGNVAGLLDSNLNLIISHQADIIYPSQMDSLFTIEKNGKNGLIHKSGKVLAPPVYDVCWPASSDMPYIQLKKEGKEGLMRSDGTLIFEAIYESAGYHGEGGVMILSTLQNGIFTYYDEQLNVITDSVKSQGLGLRDFYSERINGGHQILNQFGKPIGIPVPKFRYVHVISDSSSLALLYKDSLIYVLRPNGQMITNESLQLKNNTDKFCGYCGLFGVSEGNQSGVIDHHGNWVIPLMKQEIIGIKENLIVIKRGEYFYLFSPDGKKLNEKPYSNIVFSKKQKWLIVEKDKKSGYIDSATGQVVISPLYDLAFPMLNGYATASLTDKGKTESHIIDSLGQIVLTTVYDEITALTGKGTSGYYFMRDKKHKGLLDRTGRKIMALKYADVKEFADTTLFIATSDDQLQYFVNRRGEIIFSDNQLPVSDQYLRLNNGHYVVQLEGHAVILNDEAKILKSASGSGFRLLEIPGENSLIEVKEGALKYLIDAETLVEYRKRT